MPLKKTILLILISVCAFIISGCATMEPVDLSNNSKSPSKIYISIVNTNIFGQFSERLIPEILTINGEKLNNRLSLYSPLILEPGPHILEIRIHDIAPEIRGVAVAGAIGGIAGAVIATSLDTQTTEVYSNTKKVNITLSPNKTYQLVFGRVISNTEKTAQIESLMNNDETESFLDYDNEDEEEIPQYNQKDYEYSFQIEEFEGTKGTIRKIKTRSFTP